MHAQSSPLLAITACAPCARAYYTCMHACHATPPPSRPMNLAPCMSKVVTRGSSSKILAVPFPWCTSRSNTRMLSIPYSCMDTHAAMAMSFRMQKPSPLPYKHYKGLHAAHGLAMQHFVSSLTAHCQHRCSEDGSMCITSPWVHHGCMSSMSVACAHCPPSAGTNAPEGTLPCKLTHAR